MVDLSNDSSYSCSNLFACSYTDLNKYSFLCPQESIGVTELGSLMTDLDYFDSLSSLAPSKCYLWYDDFLSMFFNAKLPLRQGMHAHIFIYTLFNIELLYFYCELLASVSLSELSSFSIILPDN